MGTFKGRESELNRQQNSLEFCHFPGKGGKKRTNILNSIILFCWVLLLLMLNEHY